MEFGNVVQVCLSNCKGSVGVRQGNEVSILAQPVDNHQDAVLSMRGWESFDEVKAYGFPNSSRNRERLKKTRAGC